MGVIESIKSKLKRDKWEEPTGRELRSEYEQARYVVEGEGAGAVKAGRYLAVGLVAVSVVALLLGGVVVVQWANSSNVKLVALPQGAGDTTVYTATVIQGELQSNRTIKQWLLARWIDQWRGVGLDPVDYNRNYFEAQGLMCESVAGMIDAAVKPDANRPDKLTPEKMFKLGVTRRVHVRHVTPRGGEETNAFRIDWTETLYKDSKVIGQANHTADVELRHFAPKTADQALRNPYSHYVCAFDWSEAPG